MKSIEKEHVLITDETLPTGVWEVLTIDGKYKVFSPQILIHRDGTTTVFYDNLEE